MLLSTWKLGNHRPGHPPAIGVVSTRAPALSRKKENYSTSMRLDFFTKPRRNNANAS